MRPANDDDAGFPRQLGASVGITVAAAPIRLDHLASERRSDGPRPHFAADYMSTALKPHHV